MIPLIDILTELRVAPRLSGTPECDAMARRLAGRFEEIGYSPEVQDYTFIGWRVLEPPRVINLATGHELPARAVTWCGGIGGVDVEGQSHEEASGTHGAWVRHESMVGGRS